MPKDYKVQIGGRSIDVLFRSEDEMRSVLSNSPETYFFGCWQAKPGIIMIDETLKGYDRQQTVIHEELEAINQTFGLDLDHRTLTTIAEGFSQLFSNINVCRSNIKGN